MVSPGPPPLCAQPGQCSDVSPEARSIFVCFQSMTVFTPESGWRSCHHKTHGPEIIVCTRSGWSSQTRKIWHESAYCVCVGRVGNNTVARLLYQCFCARDDVLSCCNIVSCTPHHYTRDTNPHSSQLQATGPREGSGQLPRNSGNILLRPPVSALG